jgi:hypothetical protein
MTLSWSLLSIFHLFQAQVAAAMEAMATYPQAIGAAAEGAM